MENQEPVIPITRPQTTITVPGTVKSAMEKEGKTIRETSNKPPDSSFEDIPQEFVEKTKYPTEIVDLPSRGWFYPEGHPLSSGKIELKMMTAKEEDILTSQNLIKKGVVLQKLVESLIVNKKIKLDDILLCDMNGIFVAIRRLAYGDQYGPLKIKCPSCGDETELTVDLSTIKSKPFSFEEYPKHQNLFTFTLPYSNKVVTYKILTQKEDDAVDSEVKSLNKISKERSTEVTTRLKHLIQSVNGDDDKMAIRKFVENELVSRDTLALRKYVREHVPDVDLAFPFTCSNCGHEERMDVPLTVQFFWPSS